MGHTPSRVRLDSQSTGSVGQLTRLDRQHDHSIRQLVPSTDSCAQPLIPALCPVQKVFKPFWAPALVLQALPAIILAALRRSRGPALFRGLGPSPSPGAPFWPSGLSWRSSRPAYGGRLTSPVGRRNQYAYRAGAFVRGRGGSGSVSCQRPIHLPRPEESQSRQSELANPGTTLPASQ